MGTYGSRSMSVGGTAIMKALDKIEAKAKKIAAHLMEASDADVEFANSEFTIKGTDKKVTFGQVALTAYVPHNYPLDKLSFEGQGGPAGFGKGSAAVTLNPNADGCELTYIVYATVGGKVGGATRPAADRRRRQVHG
jgi:CO/xanthine dehydrogenase Mo-binding subunit